MAATLTDVKVDIVQKKGQSGAKSNNQFVYVNPGFVGSVNSVNNEPRTPEPITGVYREQYWACSKWPYTQRVLAIAVGVLLGALIGLGLSMIFKDENDNVIAGIFKSSVPD